MKTPILIGHDPEKIIGYVEADGRGGLQARFVKDIEIGIAQFFEIFPGGARIEELGHLANGNTIIKAATVLEFSLPISPPRSPDSAEAASRILAEIANERRRQIDAEGWSTESDDRYRSKGELAAAAACYARNASGVEPYISDPDHVPLEHWFPIEWKWNPKDPRRDLVRAAALLVAEIERLDRKGAKL